VIENRFWMSFMKRMVMLLLLAGSFPAPVFASPGLTAGEQAFVRECRENVDSEQKRLSVATALECVKKLTANNGELLTRISDQNPGTGEAAADILSRNSALMDLEDIVSKNTGFEMVPHLMRVLEDDLCPLCSMGLGPRPEKIFNWTAREAGTRLSDVKKSVRSWESLGEIRTRALSSAGHNYDKKRWNAQTIKERYFSLSKWAAGVTESLTSAYGSSPLCPKFPADPRLLSVLREDLDAVDDDDGLRKLAALTSCKTGDGKRPAAPARNKTDELYAASKSVMKLEDLPVPVQAAYLNETFDQAGSHPCATLSPAAGIAAAKPRDSVFRGLSQEQAAGLPGLLAAVDAAGNLNGPLAEELRGTRAGDEILAFYRDPAYKKAGDNRFKLVLAELDENDLGGWSLSSKKLRLNILRINNWMKTNHVSPGQLFERPASTNPHLQKLSRYLAPTFVHEATHQRQNARAAAAGINYQIFIFSGDKMAPDQMEIETEAFSMDASFTAGHLRGRGASYADELDPFDRKNAQLFLEKGVEGIRLANHRNYYKYDSLEGSAAKEFFEAAPLAKELMRLESGYRTAPRTLSKAKLARMRALRSAIDSRFKWYAMVRADSAAFEKKINGWRKEIKSKLYPSREACAPPELPEP
jgi:hypothetical protein